MDASHNQKTDCEAQLPNVQVCGRAWKSRIARRCSFLMAGIALSVLPARIHAQDCPQWPCYIPGPPERMSRESRYVMDIGANVLIGGLTGGVAQRWNGGSFWRGFAQGAAGGGLVFGGKQIAAERFTGAGLLGRQVAAVGSSVVSNAAADRPALSRLVLPVGPVRVYAEPGARRAHAKLDLAGAIAIGYAATRPGAHLDVEASLSAGAPVFLVSPEWGHRAGHIAGVILADESEPDDADLRAALAHERVHVSQYDFAAVVWGEPGERWIASKLRPVQPLYRYVDLGTAAALWGGLNLVIPQQSKPWEHEAHLLSSTR